MQFLIDVALSFFYLGVFFLLCAWSWRFWMMYKNQSFINDLKWVMLEIKLPREIRKSPVAMETALLAFIQSGGVGDWYAKNFKGALPATASLEIASLEGIIHFYVRIQTKFRPLVESSFYAQYPGIEIVEAEDYTSHMRYDHRYDDVGAWGATYPLAKTWEPVNEKGEKYDNPEDPKKKYSMKADFLPIKTYVDYGLEKDPKEEFKTDPLTQLLEFMGSIGKGENVWYQIVLQDESVYDNNKFPKFYVNKATHEHVSLSEMALARKKWLRTSVYQIEGKTPKNEFGVPTKITKGSDENGKPIQEDAKYVETKAVPKKEMDLTPEEKDEIEAINKKLSKPLVCGIIRLMYVYKKENFNGGHIQNILAFGKPFIGLNRFSLSPTDPYSFPWQDVRKHRSKWRTEEKFEAYVEREGFFPHVDSLRKVLDKIEDELFFSSSLATRRIFRMMYEGIFHPFSHPQPDEVSTFNLEEIATLWHFPGQVANIPTLPRIDSAKGVAPVNLPR